MNLHELSASLQQQGVKHLVVIAKPEQESKLREFFEHFINVFPKFRLWNVKDLKAGAKYGLTTIKPFLAGDANQAQVLPMAYQVNPVLTVEKFPHSETHAQAKKLVRETYGPHLKKTLDVVYGLRSSLRPIETKDEYGAVVEFEDAGKPMRATLKITEWSDHGDETELAIYVTINRRRNISTAHTSTAATNPEKIAEDKLLQGKFQQELGTIARSVGFTDVSSFVIDISRNHNTCYAVALYLKPYVGSGGPTSYKMVLRRDKDTITEYDPDMISTHGMSKSKLGSFKMSKLRKELEGIFVKQGKNTSAVAAFAKSVEMADDVKRALDEYKQELADALSVVGKPNAVSDYIDKSKYIVFVDRHKSHNVWLDKATGIAYEGKSGPSCNLSRDIANIKDGPKARAKIIMQHMDDVRFAPRDVLDSMPGFRNR